MIIDGRSIAKQNGEELREKIAKLGKKITLAVFLVGDDPGSVSFIAQKEKFGAALGVYVQVIHMGQDSSVAELKQRILNIAGEERVQGIIVQLPLPAHFSKEQTQEILDAIPLKKDPDFLSSVALGSFYTGMNKLMPPTVAAFEKATQVYKILPKKGSVAVLIGQGHLIGKPLAVYLMRKEMTVFTCNKFTKNISKLTKAADLVISGAGVPNLIKGRMIKRGAIVIDFGFSMSAPKGRDFVSGGKKDKIVGDVDIDKVAKVAKYTSPVPGGMGPVTVAMLFSNLISMVEG